ncbi:MAG: ABC transporter permease subunit [Candidatus Eremiobacteraeota bacterium]|nr:ABC transporter permease subunit [Candidatus Eremiobacteraeota bacterium]MBV8354486.1 ABC transporter permease subunit [Candidatus Eremiobacteraeota bacterium]
MKRIATRLGGIAVVLIVWELVGRRLGDPLFAPPSSVIVQFIPELRDGSIFATLATSLRQMFVGFALAYLIGAPVGVWMARSIVIDALIHPWLNMAIVTSVAALVPLFILLFGTGFWFQVTIVFIAALWFVMLTVYHGARGIEPRWLEVGRAFGAGPLESFWKIMLPALFPYLFAGARIGLTHAIRAMVVAETFVIVGYGALIHNAGLTVSTAPLLGLILLLMVLGVLVNSGLEQISRVLAPWYEQAKHA